jgi:hypothetical protein
MYILILRLLLKKGRSRKLNAGGNENARAEYIDKVHSAQYKAGLKKTLNVSALFH